MLFFSMNELMLFSIFECFSSIVSIEKAEGRSSVDGMPLTNKKYNI